MSQKRQQEDRKPRSDDNQSSDDKRRKVPSLRSVVADVVTLGQMQQLVEPVLEPLIRKIVKEEVDSALRKHLISMRRNCEKEVHPSESRSLQLQFLNNISLPVFTGTRIEGENGNGLQVALVDAITGKLVSSSPECSAKVEIVVLEGDFDGDEGYNWTREEFKNNIVREREGKKHLLTGDAFLTLNEGIGLVGDISFTDNSSWTRSRKFRLGARLVDSSDRIIVREAKTEPFIVRDHRGELYKKHHPPSLLDEVWRLEKIGKDGAFHKRLNKAKVLNVQDFLRLFFLDPTMLRNVLGPGMSAKMWEVTLEHAQTCVLDNKYYLYHPPGSQQKRGVAFTVVGQLTGIYADGQYIPNEKLSEAAKADARAVIISAFKHSHDVVSVDNEAFLMGASCLPAVEYSSNSTLMGQCSGSKELSYDQNANHDYLEPSTSSPDNMPSLYSFGTFSSLEDYGLQIMDSVDVQLDQPLSIPGQVANVIYDTDSMTPLCEDDHLQFLDPDYLLQSSTLLPSTDLQTAVNGFLVHSAPKAQRTWKILYSVLRWWFSIRRIVARKSFVRGIKAYASNAILSEKL